MGVIATKQVIFMVLANLKYFQRSIKKQYLFSTIKIPIDLNKYFSSLLFNFHFSPRCSLKITKLNSIKSWNLCVTCFFFTVFKERWFRLINNYLFYFKISEMGKFDTKNPAGVFVMENSSIQMEHGPNVSFSFSISFM